MKVERYSIIEHHGRFYTSHNDKLTIRVQGLAHVLGLSFIFADAEYPAPVLDLLVDEASNTVHELTIHLTRIGAPVPERVQDMRYLGSTGTPTGYTDRVFWLDPAQTITPGG